MIKIKDNPIEGIEINMGGTILLVPALNMALVKKMKADLIKMDKADDPDKKLEASLKVIHQAIKRNYPEITVSELEEIIDMRNLTPVTLAVMGQTGFEQLMGKVKPAPEEES